MTGSYHLVPAYISHDTREAFGHLAVGAADGEVIGSALVVFLKGRRYFVDAFGACERNATLARGAVQVLDDLLADIIRGRDPTETR